MREILINYHQYETETTVNNECHEIKTNHNNGTISKLLDSSGKCFSIEVCPDRRLEVGQLPNLNLNFCSVTWHSPSAAHFKHVGEIPAVQLARRFSCQGYNMLLHLAGRNLSKEKALEILNVAKDSGVRNILALQGDPSQIIEKDDDRCDFPYAADFVKFIRLHFGNYFCIGVAGYPDKHPHSKNLEDDMRFLKEKVSSGADFIITQASYDYQSFVNFFNLCRTSDIRIPIIPGIFIISSYKTLIGMSKFCGVPISSQVLSIVSKNKDNEEAVKEFGIHHATQLIKGILGDKKHSFKGVHIFSLNDLSLVQIVIDRLGLFQSKLEYPL